MPEPFFEVVEPAGIFNMGRKRSSLAGLFWHLVFLVFLDDLHDLSQHFNKAIHDDLVAVILVEAIEAFLHDIARLLDHIASDEPDQHRKNLCRVDVQPPPSEAS